MNRTYNTQTSYYINQIGERFYIRTKGLTNIGKFDKFFYDLNGDPLYFYTHEHACVFITGRIRLMNI